MTTPMHKPMSDAPFWTLIERSQPFGTDQAERLRAVLTPLSCDEKASFFLAFFEKSRAAYRWDIRAAGYLYGGGCSDDAFMDFRAGLIGLGEAAYTSVLSEPDNLAGYIRQLPDDAFLFHEDFGYVPSQALEKAGCQAPSLDAVLTVPRDADGEAPDWDFDDDTEMQRRFPKLWAAVEERE